MGHSVETPEHADLAELPTQRPERDGSGEETQGPSRAADRTMRRGAQVGRYVVLEHLGAGGMGVVYAALDPDLERKVAIKLIRVADRSADKSAKTRLLREAQAMARLKHPNVITVHDVGTHEGSVFVAMEYVQGRPLSSYLREAERPWNEVVRTFVAAGRGLAAAHDAGLVHRDFKPDNVMVGDDGAVLVLDFGLARATADREASDEISSNLSQSIIEENLTTEGAILGTPAYMSPEQFSGGTAGPASDQFSFCVALYEGLYGRRPFSGDSLANLCRNVQQGAIEPPPPDVAVPAWLRAVVLRGLSREPAARYPSMAALLSALDRDPSRRIRIALLALGSAAAIGVAAWSGTRFVEAPGPCDDVADAVDDVWNQARADEVRSAFSKVGKPFADEAAERVLPRLDAYAADWRAGRRATCEATRVDKVESDEAMGLRTMCLDARLQGLEVLVEALERADADVISRSIDAAAALPRVDVCADLKALRSRVPPPEDPRVRQEVQVIRSAMHRVTSPVTRADPEQTLRELEKLVPWAERVGYAPLLAELLSEVAIVAEDGGQGEVARARAQRGLLVAEEAGDEFAIIANLLVLARVAVVDFNDFETAVLHVDRAEAVTRRAGSETEYRLGILRTRALVASTRDDWTKAEEALEAELALRAEDGRAAEPAMIYVLNRLSAAKVRLEKFEEARRTLDRAMAIGLELLGPSHMNVGVTHANMAQLANGEGRHEDAIEHATRAREIFAEAAGPVNANVAGASNQLAISLKALGRLEEARAAYEASLEIVNEIYGPDHLDVARVQFNLGRLLTDEGRYDEAVERQQDALRIRAAALGDGHRRLGYVHDELAENHRLAGRPERALEHYAAALRVYDKAEGVADDEAGFSWSGLGLVQLAIGKTAEGRASLERAHAMGATRAALPLAKLLWEAGEVGRATELATEGERRLVEAGDDDDALAELRAWIAEHRPTDATD